MEEDEAEIYDGVRAEFPLTFGKQSKPITPLEKIHNTTRRSGATEEKGFPSLSSSSKSWLDSLRKPGKKRDDSGSGNPKFVGTRAEDDGGSGGVAIGPPRPPPGWTADEKEEEEENGSLIGPPRLPAGGDAEESDGEMIGPPPPPPGLNETDSDSDGGADIGSEGRSPGIGFP